MFVCKGLRKALKNKYVHSMETYDEHKQTQPILHQLSDGMNEDDVIGIVNMTNKSSTRSDSSKISKNSSVSEMLFQENT